VIQTLKQHITPKLELCAFIIGPTDALDASVFRLDPEWVNEGGGNNTGKHKQLRS
jgi:hypothetical protein